MAEEKNIIQNQNSEQSIIDKKRVNPSDIKGKIEITDNRERRDGPGGN